MTTEEKIRIWESEGMKKARNKLMLAYLLADVINSYMVDALPAFTRNGMKLKGDEKHKWNVLQSSIKQCKAASRSMARAVYDIDDVAMAVEDIDRLAEIIWLIHDRTDTNDEQTLTKIHAMIYNSFKSKNNLI